MHLRLYLVILFKFVGASSQDIDGRFDNYCENVSMPSSVTLQDGENKLSIGGLKPNSTGNQKYEFYFICLSEWCKDKQWSTNVTKSTLDKHSTLKLPNDLMSYSEYKLKIVSGNCRRIYPGFKTPPGRPLKVNVEIVCRRKDVLGLKFEESTRPTRNILEYRITYGCTRGESMSMMLSGSEDKMQTCLRNLKGICEFTIFALNADAEELGEPYTFATRMRKDSNKNNCEVCDSAVSKPLNQLLGQNAYFNEKVKKTCSSKKCFIRIYYEDSKSNPVASQCNCRNSHFVDCMNSCTMEKYKLANKTRPFFLLVGQNRLETIKVLENLQRSSVECVELPKFFSEYKDINQQQVLMYKSDLEKSTQWVCRSDGRINAHSVSFSALCFSLFFFLYQNICLNN